VSATEAFGDDATGRMTRNILLAVAENERERAKAGFAAATASAVERGIHVAGTIPFGYVRGEDRVLRPDPDAAPIVRGIFERRAQGLSWAKLAVWAAEQGHPMSEQGVSGLVRNAASP
jgi:DNA invertase Pin-like site-specific DNA recombinase